MNLPVAVFLMSSIFGEPSSDDDLFFFIRVLDFGPARLDPVFFFLLLLCLPVSFISIFRIECECAGADADADDAAADADADDAAADDVFCPDLEMLCCL